MSKTRTITPNPPADFTPTLGDYKPLTPFRYWCQKVMPLVYDDSLSYYELLCKVVDYLNKTMEDVDTLHGDVNSLYDTYIKLQEYVNNYFSNLDVQEEINKKLEQLLNDGKLNELLNLFIPFVTPEMFGAKGDGITDDTESMKSTVEYALEKGYSIYSYGGATYLCDTITISGGKPLKVNFNNSTLKLKNGDYALVINTEENFITTNNIQNLNIDASNKGGIFFMHGCRSWFGHICIKNVGTIGINCNNVYEGIFNNIFITASSLTAVGIDISTGDCHFTDITMVDCHCAIRSLSGINYFTRIHAWCNNPEVFRQSYFYEPYGDGDCIFDDCYCDSYQYCVKATYTWSRLHFTTLRFGITSTLLTAATSPLYLVYIPGNTSRGIARITFEYLSMEDFSESEVYTSNYDRYFIISHCTPNAAFKNDTTPEILTVPLDIPEEFTGEAKFILSDNLVIFKYDGKVPSNFDGNFIEIPNTSIYHELLNFESQQIYGTYSTESLYSRINNVYYGYIVKEDAITTIQIGNPPNVDNELFVHFNVPLPLIKTGKI